MISRKIWDDFNRRLGEGAPLDPKLKGLIYFREVEATRNYLAMIKNAELAISINNFKNLAESELDKFYKQKVHSFYIALDNLQQLINQDLYYQAKKQAKHLDQNNCTLYGFNKKAQSSVSYQLANETNALLKDLRSGIENQQYNFNRISTYTHNCKNILAKDRTKKFFKAVASVAIAAVDMIVAPILTLAVGIVASPLICTMFGSRSNEVGPYLGTLIGLIVSPFIYAAAIIASPFVGAKLGIMTGKIWTGLPRKESIAQCLFFPPKDISNAVDTVAKAAKQLHMPHNENDCSEDNKPTVAYR